jgi:glutaredoxin 3
MPKVEIYTARYCPYCEEAKALLKRRGVAFEEIDIGGNWEKRDEMIERSRGQVTLPQIFINGRHVGGAGELKELDRGDQLSGLLQRTPA